MTETTSHSPQSEQKRSFLQTLEVDTRLLGMIGAFLLVCAVFFVVTDGKFLSARNIFNLTIQTVSVAIMATGMVFVIVMRHIDLSVGALLALCSAVMGLMLFGKVLLVSAVLSWIWPRVFSPDFTAWVFGTPTVPYWKILLLCGLGTFAVRWLTKK